MALLVLLPTSARARIVPPGLRVGRHGLLLALLVVATVGLEPPGIGARGREAGRARSGAGQVGPGALRHPEIVDALLAPGRRLSVRARLAP